MGELGLKVFSATKARDREVLGPEIEIIDKVVTHAMRALLVLVVACGATTAPKPAIVAPPPPPPPDAPSGPIVTTGDSVHWCYKSADLENDGACADARDSCDQMHADRLLWEVNSIRESQHVDPVMAATAAKQMWQQPCQTERAVACIRGVQVVPGTRYEVCFPTMSTCERKRYAQQSSQDLRPDGPCFVYRTR